MKQKLFIAILLALSLNSNGQLKVSKSAGAITIDMSADDKTTISVSDNGDTFTLSADNLSDPNSGARHGVGSIFYIAKDDRITFFLTNESAADRKILYYCKNTAQFTDDAEEFKNCAVPQKISQIIFPFFGRTNTDTFPFSRSNRYLFVDANPNTANKLNNVLYRMLKVESAKNINEKFRKAKSAKVNSSLTVFVRNYNFNNLENITVTMNGEDYKYSHDLSYIFESSKNDGAAEINSEQYVSSRATQKTSQSLENYLDTVLSMLDSIHYLNVNDVYVLESYKAKVRAVYEADKTEFSTEEVGKISKILSWNPEYVSLTPIALTIPEADEVNLELTIKNKNVSAESYTTAKFRTSGNLSAGIGSMLYFTNLRNNEVYTKTETVVTEMAEDGTPLTTEEQLRAHINKKDQISLGIGFNSDVSFRTGTLFKPGLNVGFFIPFDEDLTPFAAVGPGISISSPRASFNLSYGWAFGKVNAIREKYRGTDLNTVEETLTNADITEKVWKTGYYIGIGVRFNILQ